MGWDDTVGSILTILLLGGLITGLALLGPRDSPAQLDSASASAARQPPGRAPPVKQQAPPTTQTTATRQRRPPVKPQSLSTTPYAQFAQVSGAGNTKPVVAPNGCIYSSQAVVDIDTLAHEFYICALDHGVAFFYGYYWFGVPVPPALKDLASCFWDLSNTSTADYAKVLALQTKINTAIKSTQLRTFEKVMLGLIANDVNLTVARVQTGHVFESTASYNLDYAWYDDLIFAATGTILTLTSYDFTADPDYATYNSRVLGYLGNVSAMIPAWKAQMVTAATTNKTHAKAVMDIQAELYNDFAFSVDFASVCPTLTTPAAQAQCATLAANCNTAMASFATYFNTIYVPKCAVARPDAKSGLGWTPGGTAMYDAWLKYHLGYVETAQNIYNIGVARVAANRANLLSTIQQIDGSIGSFAAAATTLTNVNDSRWFFCGHDTHEQVVNRVETTLYAFENNWLSEFGYIARPRPAVITEFTSTFSATGVYDFQTNMWLAQPILNFVVRDNQCYTDPNNASTVADYATKLTMSTIAHEGIPGHGLQLQLFAEIMCSLGGGFAFAPTAFTEGWGLYAENEPYRFGVDGTHPKGLYTDPLDELSFFYGTMLRNVRLVVDPGMNAVYPGSANMSYTDCVNYMVNNGRDLGFSQSECERYLAMPGQATAYMIGNLFLLGLRAQAETALGTQFDIRTFHNLMVHWGGMFFSDLQQITNTWINWTLAADPNAASLNGLFGIDMIREDLFSRTLPEVGLGHVAPGTTKIKKHSGGKFGRKGLP